MIRARECELVALEFVVRAYITGVTKTSLWFNYEQGRREIAGNQLGDGLRKNERLPRPILTPTTKLEEHDRNVSGAEAIGDGLITDTPSTASPRQLRVVRGVRRSRPSAG